MFKVEKEQRNGSIMKMAQTSMKRIAIVKQGELFFRKKVLQCVVYEATVSTTNYTNIYFGSAEGNSKIRYNNHTLSFRSKRYNHNIELSKTYLVLKKIVALNLVLSDV